jgi:hypothetical protein
LQGLAVCKGQRYDGPQRLALLAAPRAYERGELSVPTLVALGPNLFEECFGAPSVVFARNESALSACSIVS